MGLGQDSGPEATRMSNGIKEDAGAKFRESKRGLVENKGMLATPEELEPLSPKEVETRGRSSAGPPTMLRSFCPPKLLDNCRKCLKNGGLCDCSEPNPKDKKYRVKCVPAHLTACASSSRLVTGFRGIFCVKAPSEPDPPAINVDLRNLVVSAHVMAESKQAWWFEPSRTEADHRHPENNQGRVLVKNSNAFAEFKPVLIDLGSCNGPPLHEINPGAGYIHYVEAEKEKYDSLEQPGFMAGGMHVYAVVNLEDLEDKKGLAGLSQSAGDLKRRRQTLSEYLRPNMMFAYVTKVVRDTMIPEIAKGKIPVYALAAAQSFTDGNGGYQNEIVPLGDQIILNYYKQNYQQGNVNQKWHFTVS